MLDLFSGSFDCTHCCAKFSSASAAPSAVIIVWSRIAADWFSTSSLTIAAVEMLKISRKPSARTSDIPSSATRRSRIRCRRLEGATAGVRARIIPLLLDRMGTAFAGQSLYRVGLASLTRGHAVPPVGVAEADRVVQVVLVD